MCLRVGGARGEVEFMTFVWSGRWGDCGKGLGAAVLCKRKRSLAFLFPEADRAKFRGWTGLDKVSGSSLCQSNGASYRP